jgi:hypothetical protein
MKKKNRHNNGMKKKDRHNNGMKKKDRHNNGMRRTYIIRTTMVQQNNTQIEKHKSDRNVDELRCSGGIIIHEEMTGLCSFVPQIRKKLINC